MEIRVKLVELPSRVTAVSETELEVLKQSHRALFDSVLRISSPLLSCSFQEAAGSVLVVPINLWQMQSPPLAHIDFEMARKVIACGNSHLDPPELPFTFDDVVVTKVYEERVGLLEVLSVNEGVTPGDNFLSDMYTSYADYFQRKYNVTIGDLSQPALECRRISLIESRLNVIKSRYKDTHGGELAQTSDEASLHTETLFADVIRFYPLPASFVKVVRCLPSLLFRVESLLHVDDLRSEVTLATGIGRTRTTKTELRGYEDYGLGKLETQWNLDSDSVAATCPCSNDPVSVRGPGNALLLQAVTLKSANDSINNERLETLGDSFLKFATSVFLYCERPNAYEGRLTSARMRRIGNLNLFRLAKQRNMVGKILSKAFQPTGGWVPPCFIFSEQDMGGGQELGGSEGVTASEVSESKRQYVYHKITDKGVADFMESLIGAYLVAGGIGAALRFMKWIGLKIVRRRPEKDAELSEGELEAGSSTESLGAPRSKHARLSPKDISVEEDGNLLVSRSPEILGRHFGPPPPSLFDPAQRATVDRLLQISTGRGEVLPWRFRDRALLLQALTHASYQKNRVTDCYQRLEFLGDAVLDYLITTQIYERFPDFDPGKITDMRSALVNNNLFAELAVKLGLQKLLLHCSPVLFRVIQEYERFLAERGEDQEVLYECTLGSLVKYIGVQCIYFPKALSAKIISRGIHSLSKFR